jgi:hypothetical protein
MATRDGVFFAEEFAAVENILVVVNVGRRRAAFTERITLDLAEPERSPRQGVIERFGEFVVREALV